MQHVDVWNMMLCIRNTCGYVCVTLVIREGA